MSKFPDSGTKRVTLERIERTARIAGVKLQQVGCNIIFPAEYHGHAVGESYIEAPTANFLDADPEENETAATPAHQKSLKFVTTHHGRLDFSELPGITEFVNTWNQNYLSPTLVVNFDNTVDAQITGYSIFDCHHGMSDKQLLSTLVRALGAADMFIEEICERYPDLRNPATQNSFTEWNWEEPSSAPEDQPSELGIERIEDTLFSLGIEKLQYVNESAVFAWINDVLFAFIIDNGPTFIVRSHWDPDLEKSEFTRVFLICNDFNRNTETDPAAAYCLNNHDGLQLRMDATFPISAGISDHQLRSVLGRSLRSMLHGIEHIAREITGQSPVKWP